MKASLLKSLLLVGLTGIGAVGVQAQPAPKIAVVDLAKLFDGYWQTGVQSAKINADKSQAQAQVDAMIKLRTEEAQKAQALYNETHNNPALAADTKSKADAELNAMATDLRAKDADLQSFSSNTAQVLQNEFNTYKTLAIGIITEAATNLAKSRGANILIDKSNSTTYQTSTFLYLSPDYPDLTDDVLKELNSGHPVTATPAVTPATGGATPAAPKADDKLPSVTFPTPSTK
jgi:outer membrane protein